MNSKMINALMFLLVYGVNTKSIECPESCICTETTTSQPDAADNQIAFDGKNITEWGLRGDLNNYKTALVNNIEINFVKPETETRFSSSYFEKNENNFLKSGGAVAATATSLSVLAKDTFRKKCSKPTREDIKDIFFKNFTTKTVNNSKEIRTKRTLKLNVDATEKNSKNVSGDEKNDLFVNRFFPRVYYDSTSGPNVENATEGGPEKEKDDGKRKTPPKENGDKNGGIFTYQITCDGVRDLKSLRLERLPNATRLNIQKTHFRSFQLFLRVLRESPTKFDRLAILSVTDNVINQESNEENSKSDSDFDVENHGGGKSKSESREELLPFSPVENPEKLRSPKSPKSPNETTVFSFEGKFKNVRVLNLVNNTMTLLPENTFCPFRNLEILNLSSNMIESIGNETFGPLVNLLELDLSKNKLFALSTAMFKNLTKLVYLDLSDNVIENVAPSTFQYLTSLVFLNLAGNRFSEKKESSAFLLGTGKRLKIVDVSKTGLKQVPGTLERSVKVLNLMGNRLLSIRCGDLDSYSLLSYLNLKSNKIAYVEDDALGRLELLTDLQIGENNLFQIPKSLPNNLIILNLSRNNIQNVSNLDFLNLSLLKELYVSFNQIGTIETNAFETLNQLRILDLSHNPILVLPNVYGLEKLVSLDLSYFTNVPENGRIRYDQFPFQSAETIVELNLESSPLLTAVFLRDTKTLESFVRLEDLNVRFSNVTTMRKDIFSLLPKLKVFKVEGNPWHCDREILALSEWLKGHGEKKSPLIEEENEINTAHCSTPGYLYKTSLTALDESRFRESEKTQEKRKNSEEKGKVKGSTTDKKYGLKMNQTKSPVEIPRKKLKIPVEFSKKTGISESRKSISPDVNKVTQKNRVLSDAKVQTVSGPKTSETSKLQTIFGTFPELSKNPQKKQNLKRGSESNLTTTVPPSDQRGIDRPSTDSSVSFSKAGKNDANPGISSAGDSPKGKTSPLSFSGASKDDSDSLSLTKVYDSHLSFFILSLVGLFAMATLTFTSVYFSRTRRNRRYRRHNQDIEVCSISSLGNELW